VKCQSCSKPATVHLTKIVGGQKQATHLCQKCADKQKLFTHQQLNLQVILQTVIGPHLGQVTDELGRLICPECGIKYMEFKAVGRLGCPNDYAVFRAALEPLLLRIHRSTRHVGKTPRCGANSAAWQREVIDLRQQLQTAVAEEAFEEAARLRDLLRQKEGRE
jgi:protein arginine kinase activator